MKSDSKNEKPKLTPEEELKKFKTQVYVKMQMLIGACRTKTITKSQIEKSIEDFCKVIQGQK